MPHVLQNMWHWSISMWHWSISHVLQKFMEIPHIWGIFTGFYLKIHNIDGKIYHSLLYSKFSLTILECSILIQFKKLDWKIHHDSRE